MLDLLAFKATDVSAKNEVINSDFSNGMASWAVGDNIDAQVVDGILVASIYGTGGAYISQPDLQSTGVTYSTVLAFQESGETVHINVQYGLGAVQLPLENGVWKRLSRTSPPQAAGRSFYFGRSNASDWEAIVHFKNSLVIDLTKTFGAGNEPTADQMDTLLEQFPNGWFDGTKNLFSANHFMGMYYNKVKELNNAITSLGGGS